MMDGTLPASQASTPNTQPNTPMIGWANQPMTMNASMVPALQRPAWVSRPSRSRIATRQLYTQRAAKRPMMSSATYCQRPACGVSQGMAIPLEVAKNQPSPSCATSSAARPVTRAPHMYICTRSGMLRITSM